MTVQADRRLFTVAEYHQMVAAGILSEDDRLELIEGEVVKMSPLGARHAACVKRLNRLFSQALGDAALLGVQDPVVFGEHSEPEPDLTLLRPRADFYSSGHPQASDLLLVIEVADTSAAYDREVKIPLFARAGVREAWLVDLNRDAIEVFREPSAAGYQRVTRRLRGEKVASLAFPQIEFAVDAILGPP